MKSNWSKETPSGNYDEATIQKIVKERVRKNSGKAFQYFWASFALQIMVYAMLSYAIAKYWNDPLITLPSLLGIAAYIPFTIMLMKRFKAMAATSYEGNMFAYIDRRREILESFYRFKRRYEIVLIPLGILIGIYLPFQLYIPGGVWNYPEEAFAVLLVSVASCAISIQRENKRNFEEPIARFKMILGELTQ
ncbi:MAG: hypothetical protein WDO14_04595 [Bacteroidota bacterium]